MFVPTYFAYADIKQDIALLTEKGELVVAMHSEDQPPFFMMSKKGELIGLDVDIAKEIARLLRIKVRFDRTAKTYDELIDIVADGRADLGISTLSFTPRRGIKVHFTEPYFTLSKAGLINRVSIAKAGEVSLEKLLSPPEKDSSSQNSVHLLPQESDSKPAIGILKGSAYERFAHVTFPKTEIVALDSWKELIEQVTQGKLTAVFSDSNDIRILVYKNPNITIELMPVSLKTPDYLYIAYSYKFSSLPGWVDLMIKNNPNFTISYEQLIEKYKEEMK